MILDLGVFGGVLGGVGGLGVKDFGALVGRGLGFGSFRGLV